MKGWEIRTSVLPPFGESNGVEFLNAWPFAIQHGYGNDAEMQHVNGPWIDNHRLEARATERNQVPPPV